MRAFPASPALAETAARQCGVLTRRQALDAGITRAAIAAQLAARRWQRVHPGVFATFTGPLPAPARLWAALLACGAGATLSHQTAADLYGLSVRQDGATHVSVPAPRHVRAPAGVRLHRSRRLAAARHPAAQPPRTRIEHTVLDLVGTSRTAADAIGLVAEACQRRLTTPDRLAAVLRGRRNLRWRSMLQVVLSDVASGAHSWLELRYLRGVERRHGLPRGERQARVARGGRVTFVDTRYARYRTRVELDGRLGHEETRQRWRDYARDNAAATEGEVTLRYGLADVATRPCAVASQVAAVLASRGWKGQPRRCGRSCLL